MLFYFLIIFNFGFGNSNDESEKLDSLLFYKYNEMISADDTTRYNILAPQFRLFLYEKLKNKNTFNYKFDSLSTKINMLSSFENKIRIFSWDEYSAGSWHDMASIIQYKDNRGEINVDFLDSLIFEKLNNYEVNIYKIYYINKNHYLLFGKGSNGGGNHHNVALILIIEDDNIQICKDCLENKSFLVIEAARSQDINLTFDTNKKNLRYNEYLMNEETGFYYPSGKVIKLKLLNNKFIKFD